MKLAPAAFSLPRVAQRTSPMPGQPWPAPNSAQQWQASTTPTRTFSLPTCTASPQHQARTRHCMAPPGHASHAIEDHNTPSSSMPAPSLGATCKGCLFLTCSCTPDDLHGQLTNPASHLSRQPMLKTTARHRRLRPLLAHTHPAAV